MIKIKKLDLYIFNKFISSFFISIILIIGVVIIFDISEKIQDFVEKDVPLREILFLILLICSVLFLCLLL